MKSNTLSVSLMSLVSTEDDSRHHNYLEKKKKSPKVYLLLLISLICSRFDQMIHKKKNPKGGQLFSP